MDFVALASTPWLYVFRKVVYSTLPVNIPGQGWQEDPFPGQLVAGQPAADKAQNGIGFHRSLAVLHGHKDQRLFNL